MLVWISSDDTDMKVKFQWLRYVYPTGTDVLSGLLLERTEVILGPDELVFSELDIISRSSDG